MISSSFDFSAVFTQFRRDEIEPKASIDRLFAFTGDAFIGTVDAVFIDFESHFDRLLAKPYDMIFGAGKVVKRTSPTLLQYNPQIDLQSILKHDRRPCITRQNSVHTLFKLCKIIDHLSRIRSACDDIEIADRLLFASVTPRDSNTTECRCLLKISCERIGIGLRLTKKKAQPLLFSHRQCL